VFHRGVDHYGYLLVKESDPREDKEQGERWAQRFVVLVGERQLLRDVHLPPDRTLVLLLVLLACRVRNESGRLKLCAAMLSLTSFCRQAPQRLPVAPGHAVDADGAIRRRRVAHRGQTGEEHYPRHSSLLGVSLWLGGVISPSRTPSTWRSTRLSFAFSPPVAASSLFFASSSGRFHPSSARSYCLCAASTDPFELCGRAATDRDIWLAKIIGERSVKHDSRPNAQASLFRVLRYLQGQKTQSLIAPFVARFKRVDMHG
jgi:hypothetical protein